METTTRIRLFNTRSADEEEGRGARGARRRVDSVGRARRRRHHRAPERRYFFWILSTRRAMLLSLLVVGAAGPFVSLRLLAWASRNMPQAPDVGNGGGGGVKIDIKERSPSVSLGPNSIPSVVRVERRASLPGLPGLSGPAHPGRARQGFGEGEDSGLPRTWTLLGGEDAPAGGEEEPRDVCRNTVQGMALIADSEGRVCRRAELDHDRPGCCKALPLSSASGNLPGGGATGAIASMDSYVINDTPSLPPPPRAPMPLRAGVRNKEAEGAREEDNTPRALTAVAGRHLAGRQVAGRQGGAEDGVPPEEALSTAFSCWSCDAGGNGGSSCCASYEFCVSCCQDPRRKEEREAIQAAAAMSGHPVYAGLSFVGGDDGSSNKAVGIENASPLALPLQGRRGQIEGGKGRIEEGGGRIDREEAYREAAFDHCAFRCRTYSGSVAHENSFRGPLKHCFGKFRPPATPGGASKSDGMNGNGNAIRGIVNGGSGGGGSLADLRGEAPPLQLDPLLVGFVSE